jgi:hypothetical protein
MKDDILIINNKRYVHTPEVKEERLSGWVRARQLKNGELAKITKEKHEHFDDTRMIEIRLNEVITTKEAIIKACIEAYGEMIDPEEFFKGWLENEKIS